MQRKVNKIGPSTLMISLPSKWVNRTGIKKGDSLDVLEQENRLIIGKPDSIKGIQKETTVLISNQKEVRRYLTALYEEGYDTIRLNSKTPLNIAKTIRELDMLTGFEVISNTETSCLIKSVINESQEEFDSILRRIFLINLSIAQKSLDCIKNKKLDQIEDTIFIEYTNNKLTSLCKRILSKKGYKKPLKTGMMYTLLSYLEIIADIYRDICKAFLQHKEHKISNNVLNIYERTNNLMEMLYLRHKNFEKHIPEFIKKRKQIVNDINTSIKDSSSFDSLIIQYLGDIARVSNEIERIITIAHL